MYIEELSTRKPLFASQSTFVVPPTLSYLDPNPRLFYIRDYYRELFYSNVHLNFIGSRALKTSQEASETVVLSLLKRMEDNEYWALKTTKKVCKNRSQFILHLFMRILMDDREAIYLGLSNKISLSERRTKGFKT